MEGHQSSVGAISAAADAIAELDCTRDLPRVHAGTLVIAAAGAGTPPSMAEAIVERIPGAQLAVIPAAARLSAIEKPEEFAGLMHGFLVSP